jgi:biotin carboxyl carrier protein
LESAGAAAPNTDAPAAAPEAAPANNDTPAPKAAPAPPPAAPAPAAQVSLPEGAKEIRMPLLSDTMTEGKIVSWNKKVGDVVKSDDVLADVETDKATMEVVGYEEGTLLYIGVEAGQAAKINEIIAVAGGDPIVTIEAKNKVIPRRAVNVVFLVGSDFDGHFFPLYLCDQFIDRCPDDCLPDGAANHTRNSYE